MGMGMGMGIIFRMEVARVEGRRGIVLSCELNGLGAWKGLLGASFLFGMLLLVRFGFLETLHFSESRD